MKKFFTWAVLLLFAATSVLGQRTSMRRELVLGSKAFSPADIPGLVAWYDVTNPKYIVSNPVGAAPGSGVSVLYNRAVSSRTGNLLVQSEDFSTTWTRSFINAFGATDTGALGAGSFHGTTRTAGPVAGAIVDFLQEDGTSSQVHVTSQTASFTVGIAYTFYVFVKAAGRTGLTLRLPAAAFTAVQDGKYNLSAGTAAVRAGTPSVAITSIGSSWYLCAISATATVTASAAVTLLISSDDGSTVTYNGDNTSGLFVSSAALVRLDMTPVTGPTLAQGYYRTTTVSHDPIHDLLQATAASQGQLSRRDRKGNWLKQSAAFNTTWSGTRINAFGATDTGALGVGSFANTARTLDPIGTNTADFVQEDGTAGLSHRVSQSGGTVPSGSYRFALWAKPAGRNWLQLKITVGADAIWCSFDVQNGVVGTASQSAGGSLAAGLISSAGNGWYLCTLTGTVSVSGALTPEIWLESADNTFSYNGDNTSGLFLWGASLVESNWDPVTGPTEAQGYVATTTLAAFPGQNGRQILISDGSDDYWKTLQFQLAQPCTVVWFGKQITWTDNDRLFDGFAYNTSVLYQTTTSPQLRLYAGSGSLIIAPSLGSFGAVVGVFNGASSSIRLNSGAAVTGDAGSSNANGLTLGTRADFASAFSNTGIGEVCIFNRALDANEIGKLVAYGAKKFNY